VRTGTRPPSLAYVGAVRLKARTLAGIIGLLALVAWASARALVPEPGRVERLARARNLRSEGQPDRAEALLLAQPAADAAERAASLGLLGRLSLDRGDLAMAQQRLEQAIVAGRAANLDEGAVDDALALSYLLSELRGDLAGAARVLDDIEPLVSRVPLARARLSYQRGLLAFNTGELGAALGLFRSAGDTAGSDQRTLHFAREMEAFALASLGRFEASLALMAALALPAESTACERADRAANRGFLAFLTHEAERGEAPAERVLLREMRTQFDRAAQESERCGDPQRRKNAAINLGLAALAESDAAGARRHLQDARGLTLEDRKLLAWELELAGRLALSEGDSQTAESTFRRSVSLADAAFDLAWSYRAQWGLGRALRARGDLEAASTSFEQAEQSLNKLLQSHAPLSLDQSAFLAGRDGALREWLEVLVARAEVPRAHAVARRAIARAQRQAAQPGGSGALSAEQRQRMQRELGTYRALRAELDAQTKTDWAKSARALAEAQTERKVLQQQALAALDRAYAFEPMLEEPAITSPARGVLELTYFPVQGAWLAFSATSKGVLVELVAAANEAELSTRLLAPFTELIRSHAQVAIRTYGASSQVDFHALPFDGHPLIEGRTVVYPLEGAAQDARLDAQTALVLVDPSASFADSEAERQTVSRVVGARGQLRTLAVSTRETLLSELEHASFFHFGGHALAAAHDPLSSRLLLGRDQALSVADVLSLSRAPHEVVLAACESGKPSSSAGPVGLSLAAAFVARGARHVAATTRPVSNQSAQEVVKLLYQGLEQGLTLPLALAQAQRALLQDAPSLDAAAFRLWTNSTEPPHDSQTLCDACKTQRDSVAERDSLRAFAPRP